MANQCSVTAQIVLVVKKTTKKQTNKQTNKQKPNKWE